MYIDKGDDNVESKEDKDKDKGALVSIHSEAFVYNEELDVYTVSLNAARLLKWDYVSGQLTFEIQGAMIDTKKSDKAEKQMDDKYIDNVLDEIHGDNPDTEAED